MSTNKVERFPYQAGSLANLELAMSFIQQLGCLQDDTKPRTGQVRQLFQVEQDPHIFVAHDIQDAILRITGRKAVDPSPDVDDQHIPDAARFNV